jgi:predicted metal-dependent phosphoesterase TrpH
MLIDLHTHSTASDGTDTPGELVAAAAAAGLDVVAITDHDTTAGWIPAVEWLPAGLTLVRGAEFSCRLTYADGSGIGLHLLGYLFDPEHEALKADRARLRESRRGRGKAIVDNLIADGVPITWDRVQELAGGGSVGRPHIGRALVEQGVVPDVNAAFADHLSDDSKYYVPKADSDVYDVIAMIKAAGGASVFAHPLARRRGAVVDEIDIVRLAEAGLDGIEVDHPDHAAADRELLAGLSRRFGLIATGSSDYHGTNKSTPIGACTTDPQAYEALLGRARALAPVTGTPA